MKKIIIFSLFITSFFCTSAQVAVITCNTAGEDCFNANPETSIIYGFDVDNSTVTSGNPWTKESASWTATSNDVFMGSPTNGTGFSFSTKWKNTGNGGSLNTRKITLSAVVQRLNSNNVKETKTITAEKLIKVKHIGPMLSMNIQGTGLNNTLSNAGTVNIPCSINSLILGIPDPFTDMSTSVVYTWSFPSGWVGSTSTNSLVVQPGSPGQITVTARRNDGTFIQNFFIFVTRPVLSSSPLITSINWSPTDKPLCTGQTRQLTGSAPNATIFNWTASGGTTIVSGANSPTVTVQGTTNGTLTLTANNACNTPVTATQKVFAGVPSVYSYDVWVDGHPNYYPNYTTGNSYINFQNESSCTGYKWELIGGSGFFYVNNGSICGPTSTFNGITFDNLGTCNASTYSSMALRVKTANICGQGTDIIIPLQIQGSGGYYRMASPNPTTTTVSVDLVSDLPSSKLKKMTFVSDAGTLIVKSHENNGKSDAKINGKNASFDVANLPKGTYYLVLVFDDNKSFKETIVLN